MVMLVLWLFKYWNRRYSGNGNVGVSGIMDILVMLV